MGLIIKYKNFPWLAKKCRPSFKIP